MKQQLSISTVLIVYPSWIFSLAGYRLYKIVLQNNIEVLLLSKQNVFNIANQTIK